MPGLMVRLLSMLVSSTATPLQGSPLMFHAVEARTRHLRRIVFSAATAHTRNARVRRKRLNCFSFAYLRDQEFVQILEAIDMMIYVLAEKKLWIFINNGYMDILDDKKIGTLSFFSLYLRK
jgi:hypothetical protein